eukprot:6984341-Lingulodinium_polyedra.AAC.1
MGGCLSCGRRRVGLRASSTRPLSALVTQLFVFPGLAEPARCSSAPHWASDGSCSQLPPSSGE